MNFLTSLDFMSLRSFNVHITIAAISDPTVAWNVAEPLPKLFLSTPSCHQQDTPLHRRDDQFSH
jgi:hypothetical protein